MPDVGRGKVRRRKPRKRPPAALPLQRGDGPRERRGDKQALSALALRVRLCRRSRQSSSVSASMVYARSIAAGTARSTSGTVAKRSSSVPNTITQTARWTASSCVGVTDRPRTSRPNSRSHVRRGRALPHASACASRRSELRRACVMTAAWRSRRSAIQSAARNAAISARPAKASSRPLRYSDIAVSVCPLWCERYVISTSSRMQMMGRSAKSTSPRAASVEGTSEDSAAANVALKDAPS